MASQIGIFQGTFAITIQTKSGTSKISLKESLLSKEFKKSVPKNLLLSRNQKQYGSQHAR
jgi:hypothetical protein